MVKFCPFKYAGFIGNQLERSHRDCDMADCEMWDPQRETCGLKVTS